MPNLFDIFGRPKQGFRGAAYCQVNVAVDDSVRQFTTDPVRLLGAMIQAQDNDQVIGDADLVDFLVPAGSSVFLSHIDVRTLRVQNATAGQDGTLVVFGTRE